MRFISKIRVKSVEVSYKGKSIKGLYVDKEYLPDDKKLKAAGINRYDFRSDDDGRGDIASLENHKVAVNYFNSLLTLDSLNENWDESDELDVRFLEFEDIVRLTKNKKIYVGELKESLNLLYSDYYKEALYRSIIYMFDTSLITYPGLDDEEWISNICENVGISESFYRELMGV